MSALREMLAFFGVEADDKKLDHAGEKMERLAKQALDRSDTQEAYAALPGGGGS